MIQTRLCEILQELSNEEGKSVSDYIVQIMI